MKRFVFRFMVFIIGAIAGALLSGIFVDIDSIWNSLFAIVTGAVVVYFYIRRFEPLELI